MTAQNYMQREASWNWISYLLVFSSIQFLVWQMCHDSVPFKPVLISYNLISSNLGSIHNTESDEMFHTLLLCSRAKGG